VAWTGGRNADGRSSDRLSMVFGLAGSQNARPWSNSMETTPLWA
jgi:hypothetical protein